jgi:hypothetical protein
MNKLLKGKGLAWYASLVAAAVGVLALLVYLVYNLAIGKFTVDVFLAILAGIAFAVVALTTNFKFAPVLTVLGYSLAFGLYVNDRVIMFEEMINHITGMTERGNIVGVVILILVLLFVAALAGIVASFADKETAK